MTVYYYEKQIGVDNLFNMVDSERKHQRKMLQYKKSVQSLVKLLCSKPMRDADFKFQYSEGHGIYQYSEGHGSNVAIT